MKIRQSAADAMAVINARWYLRHADSVGPRVRLRGRPIIHNGGTMIIGDRARLVSTTATLEMVTMTGGTLEIGERTFVNYGTSIAAGELVHIGANCLIGSQSIIMDNDFHRLEPERRLEVPESRPIVIEDNVWIGVRVIVLGGVTIGQDSCVAAGSVVNRDVPRRTLVGGIPAKVIREL